MLTLVLIARLIIRCLHCPFCLSLPLCFFILLWLLEIAHKVSLWKCHRRQLMTKLRLQEAISELAKESLVNSKVFSKYEQTEAIQCGCKTVFLFLQPVKTVPGKQRKSKTSAEICSVWSNKNEPEGEIMCPQVLLQMISAYGCLCV